MFVCLFERPDTSEMENLFFSTEEVETIAQDSRCKSSLSEAATFWLASSGCPFASARLRDILSRTMSDFVQNCNDCLIVTEVTLLLRTADAKARWAKQPLFGSLAQDVCLPQLGSGIYWATQCLNLFRNAMFVCLFVCNRGDTIAQDCSCKSSLSEAATLDTSLFYRWMWHDCSG